MERNGEKRKKNNYKRRCKRRWWREKHGKTAPANYITTSESDSDIELPIPDEPAAKEQLLDLDTISNADSDNNQNNVNYVRPNDNDPVFGGNVSAAESDALLQSDSDIDPHNQFGSDIEVEQEPPEMSQCIREWALEEVIPYGKVQSLMDKLRAGGFEHDLPKDHRTLLKLHGKINYTTSGNYHFYSFNVADQIRFTLEHAESEIPNTLHLHLNVDGVPLFKSSNSSAWPLLCSVENVKSIYSIFPLNVCVTKSGGKPDNALAYVNVITQLNHLIENGLEFQANTFTIKVPAIICDSPARAFCKCTINHNGKCGCDQCMFEAGKYERTMTYPNFVVPDDMLRTNENFRSKSQEEHHKGNSVFAMLAECDMVKCFPGDYMHIVCLGVVKKKLKMFKSGNYMLAPGLRGLLNENLNYIRSFIPIYFARKARTLDDVDHFKATEFRQFLLYSAPLALKDVVDPDRYDHWMILVIAIRILVSPRLVRQLCDYAKGLLESYNRIGCDLFTRKFLVYNVHQLVHLPAVAKRYGCLDKAAAWKYESFLYRVKKKGTGSKVPIQTIVGRILDCPIKTPLPVSHNVILKPPSNFYCLTNGNPCEVLQELPGGRYRVKEFTRTESYFQYPCASKEIGISICRDTQHALRVQMREIERAEI